MSCRRAGERWPRSTGRRRWRCGFLLRDHALRQKSSAAGEETIEDRLGAFTAIGAVVSSPDSGVRLLIPSFFPQLTSYLSCFVTRYSPASTKCELNFAPWPFAEGIGRTVAPLNLTTNTVGHRPSLHLVVGLDHDDSQAGTSCCCTDAVNKYTACRE